MDKALRKDRGRCLRGQRRSAIIDGEDGEAVVPGANGTTDFSVLQNELKAALVPSILLCLNGYDLRKLTLAERKAQLE